MRNEQTKKAGEPSANEKKSSKIDTAKVFTNPATGKHYASFDETCAIPLQEKDSHRLLQEIGLGEGRTPALLKLAVDSLISRAVSERNHQFPLVRAGQDSRGIMCFHREKDRIVELKKGAKSPTFRRRLSAFVAPDGYCASATPDKKGAIKDVARLQDILSLEGVVFYPLLASGMSIFQPDGARAVLYLTGPAKSGKRTCAEMFAALFDPCVPQSHLMPDTAEKLYDLAENHGFLVLTTSPSQDISAAVAQAILNVSNGYRGDRPRFTKSQKGKIGPRTILLCGERNVLTHPALLSRVIEVSLPPMTETRYRSDERLSKEFLAVAGRLMMGVLKLAQKGTNNYVRNSSSTNDLAAFFMFIKAYQSALSKKGLVLKSVEESMVKAEATPLTLEPFAQYFIEIYSKTEFVRVQAREILERLNEEASLEDIHDPRWPKTPQVLGVKLKRISADLRDAGIIVEALPRTKNKRELIIRSTRI